MAIMLYNTLTKKKEKFIPANPERVGIYVCGPTTYNFIHLGNARPMVVFDTIRRYLEYRGFDVTYVQNFTDIDDKVIKQAQAEQVDPLALSQRYIQEYFQDARALNIREATVHPQVSKHIPEILEMVQTLVVKGYAYEIEGSVYFEVRRFMGYGKLSGRSLDEMQVGARVEVDERKKDPLDFALWKASRPGELSWESPWGPGRPGWHIECATMALKYLGENFDIHGGGFDLVFPHHENEIAEAESCTGQPFARYWLHNGFLTIRQEKMSKSLGNFFLVREVLVKYPPDVVRFYLLSTHYRSPLDFDDDKLQVARKGLERLKAAVRRVVAALAKNIEEPGTTFSGDSAVAQELLTLVARTREQFEQAMDDDFNTALALAALFDFTREVNTYLVNQSFTGTHRQALVAVRDLYEELGGRVLGLIFEDVFAEKQVAVVGTGEESQLINDLLQLIVDIRQGARKCKDWATADQIRDRLKDLGIILEDSPQGSCWRKLPS
jgi:cysteinyl-tRNA synthetase